MTDLSAWVVEAREALQGRRPSSIVRTRLEETPGIWRWRHQYMIAANIEIGIARLRDLVDEADVVVPFTGAGISTECGIPDFRSPGGIWTRMAPIPFDEFLATQAARDESWRRRFAMQEHIGAAKPGRGHRALASLFRRGKSPGLVTQNIDNLHQASGIPQQCVVELHGNTTYATCLDC